MEAIKRERERFSFSVNKDHEDKELTYLLINGGSTERDGVSVNVALQCGDFHSYFLHSMHQFGGSVCV